MKSKFVLIKNVILMSVIIFGLILGAKETVAQDVNLKQHIAQQPISPTFELRYFTNDTLANGETDFKGETEWMNTKQRIGFLSEYAMVASNFFNNPDLNKKIVTDFEIDNLLAKIKPQPTTSIRKTIKLDNWKCYGYRNGQDVEKELKLKRWNSYSGATIKDGNLIIKNSTINLNIDSLTWRFKIETTIKSTNDCSFRINLSDGSKNAITFGIEGNELIYGTINKIKKIKKPKNQDVVKLKIEADLTQKRFNLYANEELIEYYIPIMDASIEAVTKLSLVSKGVTKLDDLFIFNHTPTDIVSRPYISNVVLDENFQEKLAISEWQDPDFDDGHWEETTLPAVHGGIRNKEEAYYLRKKVQVGNFERAVLKLETLDPGGEIWINGEIVGVVTNRHPVEIDISKKLIKGTKNTIAIKVNPHKTNRAVAHSPTDHFIGWFLGKSSIELSSKNKITNV